MDYYLSLHCYECSLFEQFSKCAYGICLDAGNSLVVHRDDCCHEDICNKTAV